jgi:hypothetical protein
MPQHSEDSPAGATRRSTSSPPAPVVTLHDQRALQILATEHWSLLSDRSLAYNESFTRTGMFLTFLSMSFVALALLAQAIGFTGDYIIIAGIVLGFNLFIGLATYARIMITWIVDFHAIQGMNRIRHGYLEIAPAVSSYFITGSHDDEVSVGQTYGIPPGASGSLLAGLAYGLSTALGLVGVIIALLAGVLTGLIVVAGAGSLWLAVGAGGLAAILVFAAEFGWSTKVFARSALPARFPTPAE